MSNVIRRHVASNIFAMGLFTFAGSAMAFDLGGMLNQVQQVVQKQGPQAQPVQPPSQQIAANLQNSPLGQAGDFTQMKSNNPGALFEKIISLVAIPASASYTANGWDMLAKSFPQTKWKSVDSNIFPTARETTVAMKNPDGVLTIAALGNRGMLINVVAAFDSPEGSPLFRESLDSNRNIKKICTLDESADGAEIYYLANLGGLKPVTVKYEYSAGSGGGGDSITVGEMDLPESCGKKSAAKAATRPDPIATTLPAIPREFRGWWAGNCKDALNAAKHEELIGYEIKEKSVHQMELHCSVKKVIQVPFKADSKQILVNTSCDSPDGASEWEIALELNPAGKLIVSGPANKTIKPEILSRCGK